VQAVQAGRSLTEALAQTPTGVRPGVQALAFHALRHLGLTRALVGRLSRRPPAAPVQALLQVALSLLVADRSDRDGPRYAEHTLVDQAVAALQPLQQPAALAGFVNACLRRCIRERQALLDWAQTQPEARWNHPGWWIDRLRVDHPEHWPLVLEAGRVAAPMVLRVNTRQHSREAYSQALAALGIVCWPVGEVGLQLAQALPVEKLPGWNDGAVSVQDAAAQWAAPLLLDGTPGIRRVLDACAAPGGKTAHLLERADVQVLAIDRDAARAQRIQDNLARLQLQAEVRVADAGQPSAWWDGVPFDAILLDAPCTASGIVRRHPDVPWLRRPGDVAQLVAQQARLLEALWPLLRPGGRLLYATCSVFKAEGEGQMRDFLTRHPDATRLPAPGHLLPGCAGRSDAEGLVGAGSGAEGLATDEVPATDAGPGASISDNRKRGTDGFFYALIAKQLA
jgi:16S rRNA (cytosine967-C5)-methyltransferase